jgi:hypothetical protein
VSAVDERVAWMGAVGQLNVSVELLNAT